ncbi:type II secretion system F family protein [Pelomonas aquatica]|jgi:general secretion pathway protein F|uniref:Type II secretion system F family protein n=1 Tax=Pelomonas aquatica TaxID=431058 RepID=A0A9X4R4K6_9BURK|nr:type II secretion system F family protein [Pelomonas aquatica]MCY4753732.1 type II secretion system F family protein [Pelomonas aquatica]MDG0863352.1 type II secretion system F family protein [Pelomonas aquatica]
MAEFRVRYLDAARQPAEKRVQAADVGGVAAALGLSPAALLAVEPVQAAALKSRGGRSFPRRQFAQQLGVLLRAGIPLLEALQTLQSQDNPPAVATALDGVIARIQLGESFSAALASQPQAFDALFVAVVEASERSGQVEQALFEQASYLAWVEQLRGKLVAAAIYPAMLVTAGTAVVLFLLVFVVPRFAGLLDGVGGELPMASKALIAVGSFSGAHPLGLLLIAAVLVALPVLAWQHGLREALQSRLWKLPLIGPKLHLLALAQLYRCLAMLLLAGVPVVPALVNARGVAAAHLRAALDRATEAVRLGERLSACLQREGLATPVSLRMLRVGEHSGELGAMLAQAAGFYDEELSRLSDLVTRLINPALMLIMGLVIGTVVVLMYLPIFQLADQVQ